MTAAITAHAIVERVPDAMISSTVDDGLVGLSLATDKCFSMNTTAARIWDLLAQPCSAQAIAQRLGEEFDGPADRIAAAVENTLRSFADAGIVRVIG
jgi:hypothetical protein